MTDQIQHLIDRIRQDAVQSAERQSQDLLAQAKTRADAIVAEARAAAAATTSEAERKAKDLVERGTRSLEQAARDLLVQVGERLAEMVQQVLGKAADEAMSAEVVEQMLLRLADGFAKNGVAEGQIDIIVGPHDKERLMQFVMHRVRALLEQGVTVAVDQRLGRGFRLSYSAGSIHHDFSSEAVAAALAGLVRPQLAEIVMQAALAGAPAGRP